MGIKVKSALGVNLLAHNLEPLDAGFGPADAVAPQSTVPQEGGVGKGLASEACAAGDAVHIDWDEGWTSKNSRGHISTPYTLVPLPCFRWENQYMLCSMLCMFLP